MLIKNVKIMTMENETIENGWLLTHGKAIADFGPMETMPLPGGDVFDGKGGVLLPGLVDAHTHLGFEGDDGNEDTDPSTPQLRALDAINPMDRCFEDARLAGVTTIVTGPGSANAVGGMMAALKTSGRRIDDMLINGSVSMKFALGENPKTVYHGKNEAPVTRMATAAIIREQLAKAAKYAEKLREAAVDEEADKPDYDAKCEALLPVLDGSVQAHFHAHRADDIFTAIRISKEFHLNYVIIHCTEGHLIARELAKENARVLSGPFLCDRCKPELKNQTPASAGLMSAAGLSPSLITDHPVVPIQYLSLCAGLAVKAGMKYGDALRAITINPARTLGLSDKIGSIKKGKDADFAVYDGDPLAIATNTVFVSINGERVK